MLEMAKILAVTTEKLIGQIVVYDKGQAHDS